MATCHLWVTLLTPAVADVLIVGLVRFGWTVGPLADDGEVCDHGTHSTLVALEVVGVEDDDEENGPEHVLVKAVKEVLGTYRYFSIVARDTDGTAEWYGCNPVEPAVVTPRTALDRVVGDDLEDDS